MLPFKTPLTDFNEYKEIQAAVKRGRFPVLISGCADSSKAYLCSELGISRQKLIVTYSETRAAEIADDANCFDEKVLVYPAKDLLFYQADVSGGLLEKKRMDVIKAIFDDEPVTIVTSIDALLERTSPIEAIRDSLIVIGSGDEISETELEKRLAELGYERFSQVDAPGQFAVRGGIIDIYPLAGDDPVRIELFGDEVDSIRSFDTETQRSIENLESITVFPAKQNIALTGDKDPSAGKRQGKSRREVSFTDYLPEETIIFLDEPTRSLEKAEAVAAEFQESIEGRLENHYESGEEVITLFDPAEVMDECLKRRTVVLTGIDYKGAGYKYALAASIEAQAVPTYMGHFESLVDDLKKWKKEKAKVILLAGSASRAKRLAGDLNDYGISAIFTQHGDDEIPAGSVFVVPGTLKKGFSYPLIRFYCLTEGDLFGREKKKKRTHSSKEGQKITELSSLSVGDYIIHENHGLGIYKGTERIEVSGVARDYMKITYGDGGNLFTPVTQMDMVQKYADASATNVPKLNRLGGGEWDRTKKRVKTAVKEIAQDLVKLYAARAHGDGFVYSPDTVWQREFEEQFPFEETDDQLKAIEETKADMESGRIMDRLICGDVGFGKTEIAIRAAFKAVQDGKQVAYLVPTTILAQQHYNTFMQRLADYGPEVELLCRFKTAGEQKKTIEGLKKGRVDIVIGTHRLLSKDVGFKNLGLLIIDEEQRFGVSDKEKIKELRQDVDVLSLTATPIPRTLHMSLIGVRDMSVLKEAPLERMPIQTFVMEYNDEIVREAISRELARGGQVYYVYNKVSSIPDMAARIQKLLPDAVVAFAHGQMHERELEKIMLDFINGDIDVLVSTTIVETGLDISNVNTILIHDADRFGLSQLYQLRGRVGRSNRTAYAFLLYRRDKVLKEIAEKRLSTIREYTELGSGIRIAMRDLELRGAGNLLGAEQHGHMEAVGYDLYCKMLGDAVKEAKGETKITEEFDTEVDLVIDAYLPDDYVKNEAQRLGIYKRIAGIENEEEKDDVQDELIDRFGDIPLPVQNLLSVALLKKQAHDCYITEIKGSRDEIEFKMYPNAPIDGTGVMALLSDYKGDLRVKAAEETVFTYVDQRKKNTNSVRLLENLREIVKGISGLIMAR